MPQASFTHIPKIVQGFPCGTPRVILPLPWKSKRMVQREFIYDTGCAVTLIPQSVADLCGVEYDNSKLAPEKECPKTMAGRLNGYHGKLTLTFLEQLLNLPCFVYLSMAPAPKPGPPGARQSKKIPSTMAEYEQLNGDETDEEHETRCILGRLGFQSRFHVVVNSEQTIVSTEPLAAPAPPRRWFWFSWFSSKE
jgi:hypothetical protein